MMSGFRSASALVCVLVAGSVGDRAGAQILTPGILSLDLAGEGCPTTLSADWASLEAALCGGGAPRAGGAEDCRLTAGEKSAFDPDGLSVAVLPDFETEVCGTMTVPLAPTKLLLRGKGLVTACGSWSWTLDLAPKASQPVSKVTFLPHPRDLASGVTSGAFEIAGRMRFVHERTWKEVSLPWNVTLDFVVRWRIDESIREGSNLQLLTDPAGCAAPACLTELKKCGRLQLVATERLPGRSE
jgi:hypothetical protein